MENFNRDEVKEEVLKASKWARFFFMFVYSFVVSAVLNIAIGIAIIQFLFFLFTSKINASLFDFNKHMYSFIEDTLKFLLFETEEKPFPFKKSENESDEENTPEIVEGEADVVSEESEEVEEPKESEEDKNEPNS